MRPRLAEPPATRHSTDTLNDMILTLTTTEYVNLGNISVFWLDHAGAALRLTDRMGRKDHVVLTGGAAVEAVESLRSYIARRGRGILALTGHHWVNLENVGRFRGPDRDGALRAYDRTNRVVILTLTGPEAKQASEALRSYLQSADERGKPRPSTVA